MHYRLNTANFGASELRNPRTDLLTSKFKSAMSFPRLYAKIYRNHPPDEWLYIEIFPNAAPLTSTLRLYIIFIGVRRSAVKVARWRLRSRNTYTHSAYMYVLQISAFNTCRTTNHPVAYLDKKAVLSQRWPRNAPYRPTWVPWKFSGIPDCAHGYYSQHFSWAFVRIDSMNVPTKFEVRSFARSRDSRGYPQKLGSLWIRPRSIFSKIFNGLLFRLAI